MKKIRIPQLKVLAKKDSQRQLTLQEIKTGKNLDVRPGNIGRKLAGEHGKN